MNITNIMLYEGIKNGDKVLLFDNIVYDINKIKIDDNNSNIISIQKHIDRSKKHTTTSKECITNYFINLIKTYNTETIYRLLNFNNIKSNLDTENKYVYLIININDIIFYIKKDINCIDYSNNTQEITINNLEMDFNNNNINMYDLFFKYFNSYINKYIFYDHINYYLFKNINKEILKLFIDVNITNPYRININKNFNFYYNKRIELINYNNGKYNYVGTDNNTYEYIDFNSQINNEIFNNVKHILFINSEYYNQFETIKKSLLDELNNPINNPINN